MRQVKQLWEIALDRRREEQVQASLRKKPPRGPKARDHNVTSAFETCSRCGMRVERRPGVSHPIHRAAKFGHCPAGPMANP